MPIATWTRPPLPTAMSQAEYSGERHAAVGGYRVLRALLRVAEEVDRTPGVGPRHDRATKRGNGDRRHLIRRVGGASRRSAKEHRGQDGEGQPLLRVRHGGVSVG
jgi:hypothetical protein